MKDNRFPCGTRIPTSPKRRHAPNNIRRFSNTLFCCMSIFCILLAAAATSTAKGNARIIKPKLLRELPHDASAFTEGLFIDRGRFIESTGRYGFSDLRCVSRENGTILGRVGLPRNRFGEGCAPDGDRVLQLTWKAGELRIHDRNSLTLLRIMPYPADWNLREGWGMAAGNGRLFISDGSDELRVIEAGTLRALGTIAVRDGNGPVRELNELEWVRGRILANVWRSDRVAVVTPKTGRVAAWIDLEPLRERLAPGAGVANGLAWDAEAGTLYVTGKNWDKIFEIAYDF